MRVEVTQDFLRELAKRGVKAVRVRVIKDVYEWTMCCAGDACVVLPRVVVEEGKGEGERFEANGVEVYVDSEVIERAEDVVKLVVKDGELKVEGVKLEASYDIKPAFKPELPKWA